VGLTSVTTPKLDDLCAATGAAGKALSRKIFGDLRELQSTDHRLLVAFCYRHLPPDRKGFTSRVTEPVSAPEPFSRGRRLGTGSRGCQDKPVS